MKKMISIVLSLIMITQMLAIGVVAGETGTVITFDSVSTNPGSTISSVVRISSDEMYDVLVAAVPCVVDAEGNPVDTITVKSIEAHADFLATGPALSDTADSTLTYMWNNALSYNGALCTVVFEVSAETKAGEYSIKFEEIVINNLDAVVECFVGTSTLTVALEDFSAPEKDTVKLTINDGTTTVDLTADKSFGYEVGKKYTIKAESGIDDATAQVMFGDTVADSFEISMPGEYTYKAVVSKTGYNAYETDPVSVTIAKGVMSDCAITVDGNVITADTAVNYDSSIHTIGVNMPTGASAVVTVNKEIVENFTNYGIENVADKVTISAVISQEGYTDVTVGPYTVSVNPATITVKDVVVTKEYDGTNIVDNITAPEFTGVIDGDDVKLNNFATKIKVSDVIGVTTANAPHVFPSYAEFEGEHAGNYVIVSKGDHINYNVIVKVTPAKLTVTADSFTEMLEVVKKDDYKLPELTYTVSGLKGADTKDIVSGAFVVDGFEKAEDIYYIVEDSENEFTAPNYTVEVIGGVFNVIDKEYEEIRIVSNSKTEYIEGEAFDLTQVVVEGKYMNAAGSYEWGEVDYKLLSADPAEFTKEHAAAEKTDVTISLNGYDKVTPVTTEVSVRETKIASIEVTPKQTEYLEGDAFNSEVTVKAVYDNGSPVDDYKNVTVVLDSNALYNGELKPGTWTVTVTAGDTTFKGDTLVKPFDITVAQKQVDSISVEVTGDYKAEKYVAGQSFAEKFLNKYPVKVTAKFNNGDLEDVTANAICNPISLDEDGNLIAGTLVVEYSYTHTADGVEKTVYNKEIQLEVEAVAVSGIVVVTDETFDAEQIEGMELNTTGLTLQVTYNNGNTVTITGNATGVTYSPAVLVLDTPVTVTYGGKSAEVPVTVVAKQLKEIKIEDCEKSYVDGEAFVATTVRAYYDNGSSTKITDYTVDPEVLTLDNTAVAETVTVTVTWNEKTATVAVEVLPCEAINTTTGERYATVEDALTNAADGAVIELQLDAEITADVTVTADVTIETNGKNITTANDSTINIDDCDVILVNEGAADIVLSVNGKEVTVEAGETAELKSGASDEFIMIEMAKFHMDHFMFNIDVEDTANGTISVGKTYVRINDTVVAKITPDAGYVIEDVLVDGESVGAVSTYTFTKIKSNHVITAVFAEAEAETEAE